MTQPELPGGIRRGELGVVALAAGLLVLAAVAQFTGWPGVLRFVAATLSLAALAWVVAFATEQVGERLGPGMTGLLQCTLGNLPELFVVIFALEAGELALAQTALVGSVLANGLFGLGLVIVVGARRAPDRVMHFRKRLPNDTSTLLLVTVFIIVVTGLSLRLGDARSHITAISVITAVAVLGVYLAWVVPFTRREAAVGNPVGRPRIALLLALLLLTAGAVGSALVSDWFVDALRPTIQVLHFSPSFAGIVVVALAGNAVEHSAGVMMAFRGQTELAISVMTNSVAQVAALLYPALVLISLLLSTSLTFSIAPVYIGALALAAVAIRQITDDGEASAFEGWALIALYVVVAAVSV